MRDYVRLYVNGQCYDVRGEQVFEPLSDFLRYRLHRTGTKVVCAEGDCGACTVLRYAPTPGEGGSKTSFRGVNSCIFPVFLADCSHFVTVEGLAKDGVLTEVQRAMVADYGSQCGFCTPGIVMALTDMFERNDMVTPQDVKNHLTGNLCRCTGYQPILDAALNVDPKRVETVFKRYHDEAITADLARHQSEAVQIADGERRFFSPTSAQAISAAFAEDPNLRIYSGATDLGVRHNKAGTRPLRAMSLNLVEELYQVDLLGSTLRVGAKVSLRQLEQAVESSYPELSDFLHIFASPQIKESATLVGNLMNGSPIADTVPALFALDATVHLSSQGGDREVSIHELLTGYKTFSLKPGEWVKAVSMELPKKAAFSRLYKVSQRRDLDISCINSVFVADGDPQAVKNFRLAVGGVAATTIRLRKTEAFLEGKSLTDGVLEQACDTLAQEMSPLSDVRGTAEFRVTLAKNLLKKFAIEWNEAANLDQA